MSSRAASSPFSTGMAKSMTATSGQRCRASFVASWPSPTSAMISNPSPSRRARRPWRTIRWSSASRIRVGTGALHRNDDEELGPAPGSRDDLQRTADGVEALLDPEEPEAAVSPPRQRGRVEPRAVVMDGAAQDAALAREGDRDAARLRVLRHVRQRLLNDTVERGLGRRREPEVVEDRRAQLVGEVPQLLLDLVEEPTHLVQALRRAGREVARDVGEHDVHGRQELAGLVVERVGDPLDLLL